MRFKIDKDANVARCTKAICGTVLFLQFLNRPKSYSNMWLFSVCSRTAWPGKHRTLSARLYRFRLYFKPTDFGRTASLLPSLILFVRNRTKTAALRGLL